jgi:glyoxylase-like metal-dependent hydrolase (beta-lactamase superfamily II)
VTLLPDQGWDPRLLVAANDDLVQVCIVVTTRFVVLVDTLFNPATAQALVALAQPHLAGRQLLVVNTHADYDHAWGNQLFAGEDAPYPAPIFAHARGPAEYADPATTALLAEFQRHEPAIFGDVRLTPPTITVDGPAVIHGGDLMLHLIPTPGHTPDHLAVYIPDLRTLWAGDAAELPSPLPRCAADLPALRASLRRLAELRATTALYCHAPSAAGPQLLHDNLVYFDALEMRCRAALARGVDAATLADADLPAAVGAAWTDFIPPGAVWATVDGPTAAKYHAQQLRFMLAYLQEEGGGQVR